MVSKKDIVFMLIKMERVIEDFFLTIKSKALEFPTNLKTSILKESSMKENLKVL
jgi:hypothetical protein